MQITIGKIFSVVIAIGYTVVAIKHSGIAGLKFCVGLIFPLAFIWFPEEIGSLTGYFRSGYVNVQTPGIVITILSWFFLVGLPLLLYLFFR